MISSMDKSGMTKILIDELLRLNRNFFIRMDEIFHQHIFEDIIRKVR